MYFEAGKKYVAVLKTLHLSRDGETVENSNVLDVEANLEAASPFLNGASNLCCRLGLSYFLLGLQMITGNY